jgi:hypothetical protein
VRHLKRGNKGIGAPIIIRARSRPNLPSCESLYGLSRTGLRNALPEASADPYGKFSRLLVGNHRRFIAPRYHRGCPAVDSDVFWLRRDELEHTAASLDAGETHLASLADTVEQRRMLWRGQRRVTPPQLLPENAWLKAFEGFMPAPSEEQTGDTIKGVAASGGRVTATARVLSGPADFGQMQPGEVLVAGITTLAWTSPFAMASAVVTLWRKRRRVPKRQ